MDAYIQQVLKDYSSQEYLNSGGQKVVYKVEHPKYGIVALKIGAVETDVQKERIRREVDVLQKLDSPYYPKVFSLEFNNGYFQICEEFIPGNELSSLLDKINNPQDVLKLIREIVIGLEEIWSLDIVHRDIKPQNIIITETNQVKIIDLGVAKIINLDTITDPVFGAPRTNSYAAPEQLVYKKNHNEIRTDQFPIGIILVQLIYGGAHPFDPKFIGVGESIAHNIVNNTWAKDALRRENPCIFRIAERLLGYYPYQRYPRAEIINAEIDNCIGSE